MSAGPTVLQPSRPECTVLQRPPSPSPSPTPNPSTFDFSQGPLPRSSPQPSIASSSLSPSVPPSDPSHLCKRGGPQQAHTCCHCGPASITTPSFPEPSQGHFHHVCSCGRCSGSLVTSVPSMHTTAHDEQTEILPSSSTNSVTPRRAAPLIQVLDLPVEEVSDLPQPLIRTNVLLRGGRSPVSRTNPR